MLDVTGVLDTSLNGSEFIDDSTRALLFGELVTLAEPIVVNYRSDLYHDANWLAEFVNGEYMFYYGVRASGTHIGTDLDLISTYSERVYRVTIYKDRYMWRAAIVEVLK